eukprot:3839068-Pleurochrysis_carterae.AAC.2
MIHQSSRHNNLNHVRPRARQTMLSRKAKRRPAAPYTHPSFHPSSRIKTLVFPQLTNARTATAHCSRSNVLWNSLASSPSLRFSDTVAVCPTQASCALRSKGIDIIEVRER